LEGVTGLGAQVVADALDGRTLPSLAVTLALVDAWGGDVEAWEAYWEQIADLAGTGDAMGKGRRDGDGADEQVPAGPESAEEKAAPAADATVEAADEPGAAAGAEEVSADADGSSDAVGETDAEKVPPKPSPSRTPADDPKPTAEPDPSSAKAKATVPTTPTTATTATTTADRAQKSAAMSPPPPSQEKPEKKEKNEDATAASRPRWAIRIAFAALVVLVAEAGFLSYHSLTKKNAGKDNSSSQQLGVPSDSQSPSRPMSTYPLTTSTSTSSSPFITPSDASGDTATVAATDSASDSDTPIPGSQLGVYPKVQLPSGYSVDFVHDPFHPATGTSLGGDTLGFTATGPLDGRFFAAQAVVFDADEAGTFERCLNDTRYQQNVELAALTVGSLFCVHSVGGDLVLVKVDRLPQPQDANPYVIVDLTVWQGR
jgi:hypothetical protein